MDADPLQRIEVAVKDGLRARSEEGAAFRLVDGARLVVERTVDGMLRTVDVRAMDDRTDAGDEYVLFLGSYSHPPGEVHHEGRCLGSFGHSVKVIVAWVGELVDYEGLPPHPVYGRR